MKNFITLFLFIFVGILINGDLYAIELPDKYTSGKKNDLVQAVRKGDLTKVTILLKSGFNPSKGEYWPVSIFSMHQRARVHTPMQEAVRLYQGSFAMVKLLLKYGADPVESWRYIYDMPFVHAVNKGKDRQVPYLIWQSLTEKQKYSYFQKDRFDGVDKRWRYQRTRGNPTFGKGASLIEKLLEENSANNGSSYNYWVKELSYFPTSPQLIWRYINKSFLVGDCAIDKIKALVDADFIVSNDHNSGVEYAAEFGCINLLDLFAKNKVDFNQQCNLYGALRYAKLHNSMDMVNWFVKKGANPQSVACKNMAGNLTNYYYSGEGGVFDSDYPDAVNYCEGFIKPALKLAFNSQIDTQNKYIVEVNGFHKEMTFPKYIKEKNSRDNRLDCIESIYFKFERCRKNKTSTRLCSEQAFSTKETIRASHTKEQEYHYLRNTNYREWYR
jgi:hypothetical protein